MSEEVYVYLLLCANNTIYTGVTKNLKQRISQHKKGRGANYTKKHGIVSVIGFKSFENRSFAMKEEYRIKKHLNSSNKRYLGKLWLLIMDDKNIDLMIKINKMIERE